MGRLVSAAVFSALAALCASQSSFAQVADIRPSNPLLHFNGRFDWRNPEAPSASFPGSELVVRFSGTGLNATLSTSRWDQIQVIVDDHLTSVLKLTHEPVLYVVGHDLPPGTHTITLFKRTEAGRGTMQLSGLQLAAGGVLLPSPPAERNLEFIGDSITCGYGDEAPGKEVAVSPDNSNHYVSFAAVAARMLHAEHVAVAVSGIRLTENPGSVSMPTVYRYADQNDKGPLWDFSKGPVPDAVVINLGTNDFRYEGPSETEWKKSYREFIDFVRARRPNAHIFLTNGPMMELDKKLEHLRLWNQQIVEERRSAGDSRIHAFDFDMQKASDGYGSDWHPSVRTHELMAEKLVSEIKASLGW
jgi:endoglucanase